jgi:hypothetical protein
MAMPGERGGNIAADRLRAAALIAAFALATPTQADERAPEALVAVRAAFAAAAKAKDGAGLAALTAFPLDNHVEGEPEAIARAAFPKRVKEYAELAKCLATARLSADAETARTTKLWLVDCGGIDFYFGLRDGQWRHVKFANVNE